MSEALVPILKDTKDPHYRYKMPKLTAKVEGSGNGIRTVITNMSAIARALGRPPTYPTKYFGCELGAQVTMNNEYVVNGSHDPDKLMNLLYGFIRKFVLCTKCTNPETTLTVSNQNIRQKCIACGHEATIPKTIHKLTTFIINHPPDGSNPLINGNSSSAKTGVKKSEKSKSKKKGNR
jgi:translation initiation factor 5